MSASNISIHQSIKLYSHNTPQFISTQPYFSITYTQSKRQSQVHIHIPYKHNLQLSSCLHPYIYICIPRQSQYAFNIKSTSIHVYIYIFSHPQYTFNTKPTSIRIYILSQHIYSIRGDLTLQFKSIGESSRK